MKRKINKFLYINSCLIVFFTILLFSLSFNFASAASLPYGERIFYYSTQKSNVADFVAHVNKIDIIAPQTYEINYNLNASGTVPTDLYIAAQSAKIKIMPLLTNKDFSQPLIHQFLASSTAESKLISFLASEATAKGYIGWQLDIEHIPAADRDLFSAFVESAATALHAHGQILSVAVVSQIPGASSTDPKSDYYKNWSGAYDYTKLGKTADFLSLMTYDDPNSAGPSAPISFVRDALDYATSQVPPAKISLGIPLFYWGWSTTPRKHLTYGGTYDMLQNRRVNYPSLLGYNQTYAAPFLIYSIAKKIYIIWYENSASFAAKAVLIQTEHLRGFSAWVLGTENPEIWSTI
ncbi:MAG: hypothetical protein KGJ35_01560 [Patescibacteria group bacterium]|nr:hypothetical protein [Patescibacteria group bacterium]